MSLNLSPAQSSDNPGMEEHDSVNLSPCDTSGISSHSSEDSQVQTCMGNMINVKGTQELRRTPEAINIVCSRPQTCRKSTGTRTGATTTGTPASATSRPEHPAARNPFASRARHLRTQVQREREVPGPGIGKGGIRRMATIIQRTARRRSASNLRQLRIMQHAREYENDIPLLPFQRLVRQILLEVKGSNVSFKIQLAALQALRMSCEAFLTNLFEQCSMFTAHAKRVTLMPRDIELAKRIRYSLARSLDRW